MNKLLKPEFAVSYELTNFLVYVWAILTRPMTLFTKLVSGDYEATKTDHYIGVDDTSAPRTVTLPALNSLEEGSTFIVKDESGNCGTNNITVAAYGSETIDGGPSYLLDTDFAAVHVIKRSTGWFTL